MKAAALLGLIDRQIANYEELLEVGQGQAAHPAGDLDGDALLAMALRKTAVMTRVDELEAELGPFREKWPAVVAALGPEGPAVESRMTALKETLGRLIELEERNQVDLAGRMKQVEVEIERTAQAKLIKKAYGPPGGRRDNRFVDRNQ